MSFVEVEDGRLYYEVAGDGPAVVLVHPGLWDSRTWDPQMGPFTARHRVIRYDVRGYGRSTRPTGRPWSHAVDLVTVMNAAGVERAALVGCSMGGAIVLDAAVRFPARVRALVLVAPAAGGFPRFEGTPEEEAAWLERMVPIEAAHEAGELERVRDLQLEIWAPLGTDDPAGRRIRQIAFDNLHELDMDEEAEVQADPPAFERLEEIAVPTLVMPADRDPPWLRRLSAILAERIPHARLVRIDDVDHVVNLRRPEAFNRLVLEFLGELPAGGG